MAPDWAEVWSCLAGAIMGWPGLVGYCDECGEDPCTTWIGCQRVRQAQCRACGRDLDRLSNGDYAGTDCPCGADSRMEE